MKALRSIKKIDFKRTMKKFDTKVFGRCSRKANTRGRAVRLPKLDTARMAAFIKRFRLAQRKALAIRKAAK